VKGRKCRLWAGVKSMGASRKHDVLQEHAVVEPGVDGQSPVDGEDQAYGDVENRKFRACWTCIPATSPFSIPSKA
jgi:hypothetical protein